jgi:hypothetical protein
MAQDPYVYPSTGVLRNNLGIRDLAELAVAEGNGSGRPKVRRLTSV